MKPFLTGSRAYGTPRPDSDVDIVVLIDDRDGEPDDELFHNLATAGHCDEIKEYCETSACVRFGKLNIIIARCPEQYEAWRKGTEECASRKPVTRDEAIEAMKRNGVV